jgi:hypothetical protein
MTGYDACRRFMALNNHFFQPNYDFFKYKGGVPLKFDTYDAKRQDEKHRYDRLGRKFQSDEDLENFMVANLLESKKRLWVGALFGGEADNVYIRWQGRTQAIQYNLTSEVRRLVDRLESFNALFKVADNEHPEILKAYLRGDISLESFVVLDLCIGFIDNIDVKLSDDRNWTIVKHKAIKYRPFLERLNIDIPALRKAVLESIRGLGVTS